MKFNCQLLLAALCLLGMLLYPATLGAQQPSLSVFDSYSGRTGKWMAYRQLDQAWYQHLHRLAEEQFGLRAGRVEGIRSLADWEKRKEQLRRRLLEGIGGLPEKTPLKATVKEIIDRKTFRVEKLLYESLPGYMVTACLFVPKVRQQPAPAVVYCSGHSREGFRSPTYQHVILNLVHKGFIVLAFDPVGQGERYQYLDRQGQPDMGGATREHSYAGMQALLTGSSIARYMIHDGIRAVDYLLTRPEVDAERIGMTGRSGGGTQTAYIAALDPRIKAAAPENYITSFRRLWQSIGPQDAEQNIPFAIKNGLDHADLLSLRAPLPTLVLTTSRDFFSIQGAKESFAEARRIFELYAAGDLLQWSEDDAGHASTLANREAMYAFFQQQLQLPGDPHDVEVDIFSEETLTITSTGQVLTATGSKSLFDLNLAAMPASSGQVLPGMQAVFSLDTSGAAVQAVFTGRIQQPGYSIEKFFLEFPTSHYPIPFLWMRPSSPRGLPTILYLSSRGKAAGLQPGGVLEQLLQAGYPVLAPDLLNTGELASDYQGDSNIERIDYNLVLGSSLLGKSLPALQAEDLVYLLRYMRSELQPEANRIIAIAEEGLCLSLMHVAAIKPVFDQLIFISPLVAYRDMLPYRRYLPALAYLVIPGILSHYDLPQLMSTICPQKLTILNAQHANGQLLSAAEAEAAYGEVRAAYLAAKAEAHFVLLQEGEGTDVLRLIAK